MAVITKTIYFCDMCRTEFTADELKSYPVMVKQYCDNTEGRPCTPYVSSQKMDLCMCCADAICNVDVGFRGSEPKLRRVD